jgi:hypothetical protein
MTRNMFAILFSILVVMALLSSCGEMVMRVRLTKRQTSADKLAWWRRGGDEVAAAYQELFPGTRFPLFRRLFFWFFIFFTACGVALFCWVQAH